MPTPNAKNLIEWFKLEPEKAEALASVLKNAGRNRSAEEAMEVADSMLEGHGIEAIRGEDAWIDNYHGDVIATYVNMGDSYVGTIVHESESGRFILTTLGDWVEKNERKYDIR